jgi:penicillin G amidase
MSEKRSLAAIILISLLSLFLLSRPLGSLPPLAAFFHPVSGFWANAQISQPKGTYTLSADRLNEPVEVFFDERGVPRIFAQNDYDLYYAQGYITARDRLFQMELQIRAAGGYLAEWLGDGLIEYDRNQRRLGMVYGAEQSIDEVMNHPKVGNTVQAYTDGVNAFIETLNYKTFPLEYKILNTSPQHWEPIHTGLLLMYMTQMLAGRSQAVETSNAIARFGEEFVNRYISRRTPLTDPVVPPGTEWNFEPLQPDIPDELFLPSFTDSIKMWQPDPHNGSNNWVVDGSRTAGGYPILSNDMHLDMTIPSIWYEVQLSTPESNVYGVSLQGTPTVIVGFNEYIAWGSTNTGAEVMDWLEITFRDEGRTHYLYNGEWLPAESRIETIRSRSGDAVRDTILYTHHGPVYETRKDTPLSQSIQRDLALRWIAHNSSNELLTFYKLNRAKNYEGFRDAFRTYTAPAQNMNYAGTDGNIAIQTGGQFPLKWPYQGRSVGDGSDPRYDWNAFIPFEENPSALNPERGFLSAANQHPADTDYPYYLGEDFAPYERGRRINDLLGRMDNITADDFKEMQMDNFSYHARHLLPVLLERMAPSQLDERERGYLSLLAEWDYTNAGKLTEPSVFSVWWEQLYSEIWDNKYDTVYPMRRPSRENTLYLILEEPDSYLFNNISTGKNETLNDLILISFRHAIEELTSRFGESSENWLWGYVNRTNFHHLGQIPGLGIMDVFTGGGAESINAIRGSHGPSWRMVVELDPEGVRGYGVYPGGQSGNPGSKTYDEFVETWRTGELYELLFLREKPETSDDFPLTIRLE